MTIYYSSEEFSIRMEIRRMTLQEWGENLQQSNYQVFHHHEALSVLKKHLPGQDLQLYGGFKGNQLVALLPIFLKDQRLGTRIISSPPPGMHIPHLGPIVMSTSPKQRKCERVNKRFIDGVLKELDLDSRTLFFLVCSANYEDPRPFSWADQNVEVSFTYTLDVGGRDTEQILKNFSRSCRREIRSAEDSDVTIGCGDETDLRNVYEQTERRFAEQNEYFGMTWSFVRDLYRALGNKSRVYVAKGPEGRFLAGITVLYSNNAGSFWLGGVRKDYDGISMNTLLHWNIIRDLVEDPKLESISTYDMVGAGEYRLSRYKSKFNPELRRYYVINSGGVKMSAAITAYEMFEDVTRSLSDIREKI